MIKAVKELAKERGYTIFEKPGFLNIWGFRSASKVPNSFDDQIHVFTIAGTKDNPVWAYWIFKCTTDPGTFWLKNPEYPGGTAILNPGQYINSHAIGLHKGQYTALVQIAALKVTRDYNRDNVLDFDNGKTSTGIFGINLHHASKVGNTLRVDKWSAGCQVFKNINDFNFFIELCQKHRKVYGNKFTYTLIDKQMENLEKIKESTVSAKSVAKSYDVKPSTYAVFSPDKIADTLYSGIISKDIDKVLKALFQVKDIEEYKQVNEFIKLKAFDNGKGKTIAPSIARVFPKDPDRKKYRAQLFRIGLKWSDKGWTLSGPGSSTSDLYTNESAVIWNKQGEFFSVPYGSKLGAFLYSQNGVTTFISADGQPYFIHSTSIKNHD